MIKPAAKILIVSGLVLVVFGVAAIFRERLLESMAKRLVIQAVEKELGLEVTVEKITGSYLGDLRLTGVRTVKTSENRMLVSIDARVIDASYSLRQLWHGVDAFVGGLGLELDGARVVMDLSRDWGGAGGQEDSPSAALVLPVTRARDSRVELHDRDWDLTLAGMDLEVAAFDVEQGGIPLTVHAAKSVVELPFIRRQTPELAARGVLNRYSIRVDDLEVNGRPAITAARFDYGPAEPIRCAGSFSAFAGSGKIKAAFAENSTELEWDIREVDAAAVATLLNLAEPFPAGQVTSSGRLAGNFAEPVSLNGKVSLVAINGSFRNQPFGRIVLEGASDAGILRIDTLEVETGVNSVSASGVSAPLAPLLAGEVEKIVGRTSGQFTARLEDIPALLSLAGLALPAQLFPGGVPPHRLAVTGTTAAGVMRIDSLEAELGENTGSASGVSLPLADLVAGNLEDTVRHTRGSFSARLEDIPALLHLAGITVPPGYLPEGMPPHRLVLAGRASEEGVILESGIFNEGSGTVTLEHFVVTWPRSGPLLDGLSLSARLKVNLPDLGRSAELFGVEHAGGNLRAEVIFDGPWKSLQGSIEVHGKDLRYREAEVDSLLLTARSDSAGWRVVKLEAGRGEDRLTGSGVIAMNPLRFNETVVDLRTGDFRPYLGWFLTGEIPRAHGALAVQLEVSGSPRAPEGSFKAVLTDGNFDGFSVSRGELTGSMAGEKVEVTTLQAETSEGRVELAGSFQHRGWGVPVTGTIGRLTLAREDFLMELLAPVAVRVDGESSWSFEEATLQGAAGTFRLAGGVSPQAGYDLTLRLSEVKSAPWQALFPGLPVEFQGLNLEGTVRGTRSAPEVALKGSVAELRARDAFVPLAGQFDLLLSSRGLVLKTFSWTTATGEQIVLAGTIPYDPYTRRFIPQALVVNGLFSVPDLGVFTAFLPENFRVPGVLKGKLNISGTGEHPEATIDFHVKDVGFPATFPVRPPGLVSVDAVAVLKDNDLRLETFTVTGNDLKLSFAGKWRQAGNLLKGWTAADGLPGNLDLRGSFSVADIGWLARGVPEIRRLGGKVVGTLALSGPAASPELEAELSLAEGEFRAEGSMPPLRDLQVQLGFKERTATIKRFTGTVGGSPFTVSGSVLLPVDGAPEADLRVQGANILLYRSEAVGVRGDADLTVRGLFSAPAFAGTLAITDGRLRKNINWLEPLRGIGRSKSPVAVTGNPVGLGISFHNPPLKDATFAIHVTSKNPFLVKSNVARGNLRPDLWLRGTGEIPLLTGVVYIDRSRILLPAGRLSVDAGLIRFPENSPGRPQLEISGSSQILGYDIKLAVEGNYDEPTITLSSVPPLPQDALLLLLLTGKLPPGTAEQSRGWQQGVKVALYVSKGVLEEWFGGNDLDSEESLLDRFDVVTGRGISRQGNETIGAQYRLADGVVREGDELYLVAERDIYDEFNAGLRIVFHFK